MARKTDRSKALPGRLEAVVELLPNDARQIADIGYDHGYALVLAARRLPEARLCGVERIPNAARRFYTAEASSGLLDRIELFDGDGFAPIADRALDGAILAGMGEGTVLAICSAHPALLERVSRLIVCTPQMPAILRPGLAGLGFGIDDERLAYDGRRYYEVVRFDRNTYPPTDPLELLFGPFLLQHSAVDAYLAQRMQDWQSLLSHRGSHLTPQEAWPPPFAEYAGEYQRIKVRALDAARRRVRKQ